MEQQGRLIELRKDKDGARQREVQAITQGDPFEEFYRRLNEIKAYHRKYPNEPVENLERAYQRRADADGVVYNALGKIDIDSMFSGAEMHGRFMDMNECHAEYQNLHGVKRTTYLQYLGQFDKFTEFGSKLARNNQYFLYLNKVAEYLESFFRRTRPLEDPDDFMQEVHEQFEKEWDAETIEGWKKTGVAKKRKREEEEESNDPLFCKACDRAFTNDNTYNAHLEGKKHKKAAERLTGEDTDMADAPLMEKLDLQNLKYKAMAEREYRIKKLAEKLDEEREATKINVERKATLTDREWEVSQTIPT
jgi:splicing factor 3A subunit 3